MEQAEILALDAAVRSGALQRDWGIVPQPDFKGFHRPGWSHDFKMATDAQPSLVTTSSSGIPAFLANYWDPEVVRVLQAPVTAAEVVPEVKKGDWTTRTTTFTVVENYGYVASYGDRDNSGAAGINTNFPQRASYHYQTITWYGERQVDEAGLAKINYVNELNTGSINVLNRAQNRTYLFGVSGYNLYGLSNDPNLPASITPLLKQAGGYTWAVAQPTEIFADIQKLVQAAIIASFGMVDEKAKMTLALPPDVNTYFNTPNTFGIRASGLVKETYPNLRVQMVPEYGVASGLQTANFIQLIVHDLDGIQTSYVAFTEKLRAHAVVVGLSSWEQKKSQGTWGAINRRPFLMQSMLGV